MGFAFAAPDYALRAQAGLPMDASAPDQSVMAPAPAATPAPTPAAAQQAPLRAANDPFTPGVWDVLQGMIFNGQSPADAAMSARKRNYESQTMAIMADALKNASPDQQKAMLLNPAELGKAVASRFQSMALKQGETRDNGEGGPPSVTAPVMGFDEKSGRGYTSLPGMTVANGPSLGGDYSVSPTGVVISGRTGPTGQVVTLPQLKPLGSSLESFTPGISGGPGSPAPATAPSGPVSARPAASSLLNPQGQLDPQAFFKSFVLPHEGGWNARDLNGSPTKYGINAAANPGVDVANLKPEDAAGIFASKYFPSSASLPPALAAVNADTAFINPRKAAEFLASSGGDPAKYMDLRDNWMAGMVAKNPAAQKYAQAWANRNADLRVLAGQLGSGGADAGGAAPAATTGGASVHTLTPAAAPTIVPQGDPAYTPFPKGTVLQRAPTGELSVVQKPEYDPAAKATLRDKAMGDEYKLAKASSAAYQAMAANAGTMTGPSAYAMLDTFARAINPGAVARPTVIETIEKNLGLPAQLVGGLESKFGQGNLPPQVRQQIIDAVVPFAQAHWDQANLMNSANTALAKSHNFDPADVVGPLESRPERVVVQPPAAPQRQAGTIYVTPKGPLRWTGTGWVRPQ